MTPSSLTAAGAVDEGSPGSDGTLRGGTSGQQLCPRGCVSVRPRGDTGPARARQGQGAPPGRQGAARRAPGRGRPAAPRLAGQARSCGCAVGAAFSPLLRSAVVVRSGPRPRPRPDSTWHDGQYRPRGPRAARGALPAAVRAPRGSVRPDGARLARARRRLPRLQRGNGCRWCRGRAAGRPARCAGGPDRAWAAGAWRRRRCDRALGGRSALLARSPCSARAGRRGCGGAGGGRGARCCSAPGAQTRPFSRDREAFWQELCVRSSGKGGSPGGWVGFCFYEGFSFKCISKRDISFLISPRVYSQQV